VKILIDIGHPAHVHFFKNPMRILQEHGHEILVTSREKEVAVDLLDDAGVKHQTLSSMGKEGVISLLKELVLRDARLYKVVKRFQPDIMLGIGGIFIAHVGKLTGIPSLVFYDTENASLQNVMTYPLASCVVVPSCYQGWLPNNRHIRYKGYHELAYLHPEYFQPDLEIARSNGLAAKGHTFFIRTVSWQANHDIGENGWSSALLERLVAILKSSGSVLISSETVLPDNLQQYAYRGNPADIHHVMAFCRGFIGESATMASECAVLGVPAIYAAETGRGYTDEQEQTYGLVRNIRELTMDNFSQALNWLLELDLEQVKISRQQLLEETIDVSKFVVDCAETFPEPLENYRISLVQ
jgi:predicted glycosyltransferase